MEKESKMNEVCEDWTHWSSENWDNQDLWWHDTWSGVMEAGTFRILSGVATVRYGYA